LPGAVYGPRDPSVIGKLFTQIMNHKFPGFIRGTEKSKLTYIHVDDLTQGILLAFKRGRVGQSYILAAESMTFEDTVKTISQISQVKMPKRHFPEKLARVLAFFDEQISRKLNRLPLLSQEGINSLKASFSVSSEKAKRELGFHPRSNLVGFQETVEWLKSNNNGEAL